MLGEILDRKWKRENSPKRQHKPKENKGGQSHQNETPSSPNQPAQTTLPPSPKEINNPNKPKQNNPSSNQEESKPTNSPLPTSIDIQTHYNSDKAQAEITNNPNLTDTQERQKAEELLKTLITAELLIQKKQFNSENLTKLLNEKSKNSPLYQLLNKEKRIDKAINQLQSTQKNYNPTTDVQNQQNRNSSPLTIILIALPLLLMAGMGTAVLAKRKKKQL